jgi:protein-tyrosine phosphatase
MSSRLVLLAVLLWAGATFAQTPEEKEIAISGHANRDPLVETVHRFATHSNIENPTCDLVVPGTYRINFQAGPDAWPIEVFASSRPDRIDSPRPVQTIRSVPIDISIPKRLGRVYFHLKSASGAILVVSIRRLPLEGANNFRDLGGYRTSDGHYVRWGLVYRSGYLANLTRKDSDYLNSLGIRLVCDMRADGERKRAPDRWEGNAPEFLWTPVGPNHDGTLSTEELQKRVVAINAQTKESVRGYDYPITDATQYGKILHRIVAGDLPSVEHCSGGKDRTGVFSAILLTALGVPRETVIQDYVLTTQYTLAPDSIAKTTADLQKIFGLAERPDTGTVQAIMTARPETLEATFDKITKTYGSFDNYLHADLKISDSDLETLRQLLLEP